MAEAKRIEIGFGGGQVISLRMTEERITELQRTVQERSGWTDLETEDGTVSLDLGQVVFVTVAGDEHRIGFTGA